MNKFKFKFDVLVSYEVEIEKDDINLAKKLLKEDWDHLQTCGCSIEDGSYKVKQLDTKKVVKGVKK
jgi:hypothetical protein